MRRIVIWALSTLTTLVLLFSYHTSTSSSPATVQAAAAGAGSGSVSAAGGSGTTAKGSSGNSGNSGSGSGSGAAGGSGTTATGNTYAGTAVGTRFGNVQVQITVADGKITAATVLQIPNRDRKDQQINGYAVPILNREAVAAQSSDIDMVSGATITSAAYIQSLQSAIDKARL